MRRAVIKKTVKTIFSSKEIFPSLLICFFISAIPPGNSFSLNLNANFVRYSHAIIKKVILIGKPKPNHLANVNLNTL